MMMTGTPILGNLHFRNSQKKKTTTTVWRSCFFSLLTWGDGTVPLPAIHLCHGRKIGYELKHHGMVPPSQKLVCNPLINQSTLVLRHTNQLSWLLHPLWEMSIWISAKVDGLFPKYLGPVLTVAHFVSAAVERLPAGRGWQKCSKKRTHRPDPGNTL